MTSNSKLVPLSLPKKLVYYQRPLLEVESENEEFDVHAADSAKWAHLSSTETNHVAATHSNDESRPSTHHRKSLMQHFRHNSNSNKINAQQNLPKRTRPRISSAAAVASRERHNDSGESGSNTNSNDRSRKCSRRLTPHQDANNDNKEEGKEKDQKLYPILTHSDLKNNTNKLKNMVPAMPTSELALRRLHCWDVRISPVKRRFVHGKSVSVAKVPAMKHAMRFWWVQPPRRIVLEIRHPARRRSRRTITTAKPLSPYSSSHSIVTFSSEVPQSVAQCLDGDGDDGNRMMTQLLRGMSCPHVDVTALDSLSSDDVVLLRILQPVRPHLRMMTSMMTTVADDSEQPSSETEHFNDDIDDEADTYSISTLGLDGAGEPDDFLDGWTQHSAFSLHQVEINKFSSSRMCELQLRLVDDTQCGDDTALIRDVKFASIQDASTFRDVFGRIKESLKKNRSSHPQLAPPKRKVTTTRSSAILSSILGENSAASDEDENSSNYADKENSMDRSRRTHTSKSIKRDDRLFVSLWADEDPPIVDVEIADKASIVMSRSKENDLMDLIQSLSCHMNEVESAMNFIQLMWTKLLMFFFWRTSAQIVLCGVTIGLPIHSIIAYTWCLAMAWNPNLIVPFLFFTVSWVISLAASNPTFNHNDVSPGRHQLSNEHSTSDEEEGVFCETSASKDLLVDDFDESFRSNDLHFATEKDEVRRMLLQLTTYFETYSYRIKSCKGIFLWWDKDHSSLWIITIGCFTALLSAFVPWGLVVLWMVRVSVVLLGPWIVIVDRMCTPTTNSKATIMSGGSSYDPEPELLASVHKRSPVISKGESSMRHVHDNSYSNLEPSDQFANFEDASFAVEVSKEQLVSPVPTNSDIWFNEDEEDGPLLTRQQKANYRGVAV